MNLQTYLALKAVVEADFEKLIFYQTVSDIDPPNYAVKSVGPAALISLTDAAAVPAESIKIDFEPIQEDEPEPPHSYSGSFAQFASKKQINAEDVVVNIEPAQEGTGDPSPDNVRPITGWTGAKVTRTGKNLAPVNTFATSHDTVMTFAPNLPAGIYTYSYKATRTGADSRNGAIRFVYSDGSYMQEYMYIEGTRKTKTSTIEKPLASIYVYSISGSYADSGSFVLTATDFQLEPGSTATDYEPYQGDTYGITFPTEAGTVYSGTLDVTNGVLTVDRAYAELTKDSNWEWNSGNSLAICSIPGAVTVNENNQREIFVQNNLFTNSAWVGRNTPEYSCGLFFGASYVFVRSANHIASVDDLKALIGDRTLQVVYELATPITYQLTPQQIALLRGNNTIWADTGDVTIDVSAVPAPISGRTGLKLYHSGSTQNMPDLVEVDWENELGTVYGGTLDIVSGVLTVDRATETITKDSPFYSFSVGTVNAIASVDFTSGTPLYVSDISSYNGAISSTFVELQNYWTSGRNNETPAANYGFAYNSSGRCCFRIVDTSITTLAEFKAAFPDTQICYKLATPINRHLSPTQVNMLLGANTLWSDDGNITLVYKAKK